MTDADPVDRLLATARGEPVDEPFRVTGVMMQYYHVCKRELWFESRNLEIDRENPTVVRGTRVDDTAYSDKRENLRLGMVSLDLLDDGRVVEVKPSSTLTEPAEMQLSYYLWYLDHVAAIPLDVGHTVEIPEVVGQLHLGRLGQRRGGFHLDDPAVVQQIE